VIATLVRSLRDAMVRAARRVAAFVRAATRPAQAVVGVLRDLPRSRADLLVENILLRQQLIVASRATTRPKFALHERWLAVLAARMTHRWREALLLVQPETVMRWHREGFRLFWRKKSRATSTARLSRKTITLIQRMAMENRLWGAERIRGELLKLGVRVAKRTVQKYMQEARCRGPSGQTWSTFLRNHGHQTWACDFLNFYDVWFQPICAFFVIDLGSRKVVHVGVTREPTSTWAAQQMRNATAFGSGPRFVVRDRDLRYGADFDRAAAGAGAKVVRTPARAPKANAMCERFLGSVRRECLDHILILNDQHARAVLDEYCRYFNEARPHQAIRQVVPMGVPAGEKGRGGPVVGRSILNGLHHDYRCAA
jgi:putative transposase